MYGATELINQKLVIIFIIQFIASNVYAGNTENIYVHPGSSINVKVNLTPYRQQGVNWRGKHLWVASVIGNERWSNSDEKEGISIEITKSQARLNLIGHLTNQREEWNCDFTKGNRFKTGFPGVGLNNLIKDNGKQRRCKNEHRVGFHLTRAVKNWKVGYSTAITEVKIDVPEDTKVTTVRFPVYQKTQIGGHPIVKREQAIIVHVIQNTCSFTSNNEDIDVNIGDIAPGKRVFKNLPITYKCSPKDGNNASTVTSSSGPNVMTAKYKIIENPSGNTNKKAVNVKFFRPDESPLILNKSYNDISELRNLKYEVVASPISDFNPHDPTSAQFGYFNRSYNIELIYY